VKQEKRMMQDRADYGALGDPQSLAEIYAGKYLDKKLELNSAAPLPAVEIVHYDREQKRVGSEIRPLISFIGK